MSSYGRPHSEWLTGCAVIVTRIDTQNAPTHDRISTLNAVERATPFTDTYYDYVNTFACECVFARCTRAVCYCYIWHAARAVHSSSDAAAQCADGLTTVACAAIIMARHTYARRMHSRRIAERETIGSTIQQHHSSRRYDDCSQKMCVCACVRAECTICIDVRAYYM